jgi:diguanylate cyclase (GGDEF)-like protein
MDLLQSSAMASDEEFARVVRLVTHALDVPAATLAMVDLEHQHFKATFGIALAENARNVGFFAQAMLSETPTLCENVAADPRFCDHPLVTGHPGIRFFAGVGVHSPEGMMSGALCAIDLRPRTLSDQGIEALVDLGAVVERELLLRSLLRKDPLTGLRNSSDYEIELDREWRRAKRGGHPLTALIFDVDRLREFNETFGHAHGDRALREIGALLLNRFRRASDLLIRVGGDRILVLLPDTDANEGLRMAEATRSDVTRLGLGNPNTNSSLTLSVGCATACRETGYEFGCDGLLAEAGAALKEAKRRGGNTVVRADLAVKPVT